MKTLESNKIIAEFMFPHLVDIDEFGTWGLLLPDVLPGLLKEFKYQTVVHDIELKFNCDWNWLIPVIAKATSVRDLRYKQIQQINPEIVRVEKSILEKSMEHTYKKLVELIIKRKEVLGE